MFVRTRDREGVGGDVLKRQMSPEFARVRCFHRGCVLFMQVTPILGFFETCSPFQGDNEEEGSDDEEGGYGSSGEAAKEFPEYEPNRRPVDFPQDMVEAVRRRSESFPVSENPMGRAGLTIDERPSKGGDNAVLGKPSRNGGGSRRDGEVEKEKKSNTDENAQEHHGNDRTHYHNPLAWFTAGVGGASESSPSVTL